MPGPTGQFRREDRLLRSSDFGRVGREGRRVVAPAFVLLIAPCPRDHGLAGQRLGITVSRKVGSAVVRNRVKRQVREWFRSARPRLRPGIDLVVIGRSAAAALSAGEARGILCGLARTGGATSAHDPASPGTWDAGSPSGSFAAIASSWPRGSGRRVGSNLPARATPKAPSSATGPCAAV
jgi:ribonuclease P protein component